MATITRDATLQHGKMIQSHITDNAGDDAHTYSFALFGAGSSSVYVSAHTYRALAAALNAALATACIRDEEGDIIDSIYDARIGLVYHSAVRTWEFEYKGASFALVREQTKAGR